ncbi:hypothetical protein PR202_ga29834 [Eleusine coracana subsp. coracana]|uniref:RRM domain-containing protein n=1 Tax=Eleusine coracana subsp. coracana TaxID=191504 RepID=A0AAV5DN75_ELECO|nr:hypothetical protein PR202_ga29834 [Eleusine coracana subsp. coracana]
MVACWTTWIIKEEGFQGGVQQHESPALDEGLLVDPADDAIQYLSADSLPFMNDQIKSLEQNVHNSNSGAEMTPVDCDGVQKSPKVIGALLPQELSESNANDASKIQPEATHSDAYHGDSLLTENNSRDSQLYNSGRKNGSDDDYMNGRKSSPIDSQDKENFNSTDGRVSPQVRSPHAPCSEKMESHDPVKDYLARSGSPPARRESQSPERRDTHRKRASPRELSPHAQNDSPVERKRRRESRHGAGSPRRRSASPRRRSTPQRRSASPRRSSHKRRSSPRRDSPRRRDSRRESPRRKESPRRRDSSGRKDSPKRRDRSKSRSPSRRTDSSRHRREHDRSRSRSPHSRDHHRRSPRRHSPRRRSPLSSHRHHSPKRHWSPPANRKTGLGKPGRNLFVAGFSYATTERDLEKKFAKYGRVTSARVVRDRR